MSEDLLLLICEKSNVSSSSSRQRVINSVIYISTVSRRSGLGPDEEMSANPVYREAGSGGRKISQWPDRFEGVENTLGITQILAYVE